MNPETDEKFAQIESSLSLEQQRLEKLWDAYEQQEKDLNASLDRISKLESEVCLLYTSPSPRDLSTSRMPSSA